MSEGIFNDLEKSFVEPVGMYPIIEFASAFKTPETTSSKVPSPPLTKISSYSLANSFTFSLASSALCVA